MRQSHIESYQCAAEAAETALVNMMGYTTEVAKSRKRGTLREGGLSISHVRACRVFVECALKKETAERVA